MLILEWIKADNKSDNIAVASLFPWKLIVLTFCGVSNAVLDGGGNYAYTTTVVADDGVWLAKPRGSL